MGGTRSVIVTQRILLANQLPWLGSIERGVLGVLDGAWSVARGALWSVTVPWSMMITGVKGPGAWRRGHRGPVRRMLSRAFGRSDVTEGVRDRAGLEAAAEGAVAGFVGRVRAIESLPLAPAGAVWLRVDAFVETVTSFTERWHLVCEHGLDFDLVLDDEGATVIRILGTDGFLVARPADVESNPDARWLGDEPRFPTAIPAGVIPRVIHAGRRFLCEGDVVSVVGVKTFVVDSTIEHRLARDAPMRIALASGPKRPLLIVVR